MRTVRIWWRGRRRHAEGLVQLPARFGVEPFDPTQLRQRVDRTRRTRRTNARRQRRRRAPPVLPGFGLTLPCSKGGVVGHKFGRLGVPRLRLRRAAAVQQAMPASRQERRQLLGRRRRRQEAADRLVSSRHRPATKGRTPPRDARHPSCCIATAALFRQSRRSRSAVCAKSVGPPAYLPVNGPHQSPAQRRSSTESTGYFSTRTGSEPPVSASFVLSLFTGQHHCSHPRPCTRPAT